MTFNFQTVKYSEGIVGKLLLFVYLSFLVRELYPF